MPATIGHYRILRKLGEGGMGVVYLAEQESPRRQVAVKVVRGGRFVDEHQVRLFQREAGTLARLKHPGVAAIYESGRTEDGQHFFAMEMVQGATLDVYLEKRGTEITVEELRFRLGLFGKIAEAVHYAHQRGVIHRDLKPSNVIVTDETTREASSSSPGGGGAVPRLPEIKILDFGLARITEGDLAAATMTTEVGVIKGTLPYMSPEQARGRPEEIDVRTDVYALGVMLYEILAGRRPYDVLKRSLAEALRVICEEPPQSLRQSLGAAPRLDPDVETIVSKALEKEADRRYASAALLSEDISRYLTSQPILARPPSAVYQLRKFAARNRALVGGVAATVVVLLAGIVVSTVFGVTAVRKEREATWQSYVANVTAAGASLRVGGAVAARRRLSQCPPDLRGWEWGHLWSRTDLSIATLVGHESGVTSVAVSPDGTRFASGSFDETVRLWDAETGELLTTWTGHDDPVLSVAFSPDGSRVASGSWDRTVLVWDTGSAELLATLSGHENAVRSVVFSSDGTRLAAGAGDIRLWDASTGKLLTTLGTRNTGVTAVAFSADGKSLASGSWDRTVRVWDTSTGESRITLMGHEGTVEAVAFSPDARWLASGGADATVRLWDVVSGELVATWTGHDGSVRSVAFGPFGARIASASADRTVRMWDAVRSEPLSTLIGHQDAVSSVAFTPDGMRLVSASDPGFLNEPVPGELRLWNAASGELRTSLSGHDRPVSSVAFSPDGTRLVSGSPHEGVRLWDRASGDLLAELVRGRRPVVFGPDGTRIASGYGAVFRLWDAWSGKPLATFAGRVESDTLAGSVAFSPDGTRLAATGLYPSTRSMDYSIPDKTVRVWDAMTGERLATLVGHDGTVGAVVFSPDGNRLASGSSDRTVRIWDPATGDLLMTLVGHGASVRSLAFSPDGEMLASGSLKTIRLWDATTGELLRTLVGHEAPVGSLAFTPDGTRLASGSADKTVRVWHAPTGELLATLLGGGGPVAFSPDGMALASGTADNTVRLWLGGAGPRSTADTRDRRVIDSAFWGRFLGERGRYEAAESLLREALELRLEKLAGEDWRIADARSLLGESIAVQGRHDEAEPLLRESLEALLSDRDAPLESVCRAFERVTNIESARPTSANEPSTSPVQHVAREFVGLEGTAGGYRSADLLLACVSKRRPWLADALALAREAAESSTDSDLETLETLAEAYHHSDDWRGALAAQRQALARVSGASPLALTRVEEALFALESRAVFMHTREGRPGEAVGVLRNGLETRRRYLGEEHRATMATLHDLGSLLVRQNKTAEAETSLREALEGRRRVMGPEAHETLATLFSLGLLYRVQGRHDEAEPLFSELLAMRRRTLPERHSSIASVLMLLALGVQAQDRHGEAEPLLRECLEIRRDALEPGDWLIPNTMSVLGESLLEQGRYAEAEPLLLEGYESMKPPRNLMIRKANALDRLVRLYEEWGRQEKADAWRAKAS